MKVLTEGDYFGEVGLVSNNTSSATVHVSVVRSLRQLLKLLIR